MHCHIRTRLDLIHPDYPSQVLAKQAQQKAQHDRRAQERELFVGQSVMARNMRPGSDWVPAVVIERLGPLTYLVETTKHLLWKRHIDLLRELKMDSQTETPQSTESNPSDLDIPLGDTTPIGTPPEEIITLPEPPGQNRNQDIVPETPRYPRRDRQSPDWYSLYVRVVKYV